MNLAISTHWNAFRHKTGEGMIEEILALGFTHVELGYDVSLELVPGVRKMRDQKAVVVDSAHNFCPVPMGAYRGHPELFTLASLDDHVRRSAVIHTLKTAEFVVAVGASTIVTHCGFIDIGISTDDLLKLCRDGRQFSPKYDKVKLKLLMAREKKAERYVNQLSKSIEELLPELERMKIKLAIENLPYWEAVPSEPEMETLLTRFGSPSLCYWHDAGHAQIRQYLGFISHQMWLNKLSPRLAGFHIHDVDGQGRDHLMPPKGGMDFSFLKPFLATNALLVLEPAPGTPENDIVDAMRFLRNI